MHHRFLLTVGSNQHQNLPTLADNGSQWQFASQQVGGINISLVSEAASTGAERVYYDSDAKLYSLLDGHLLTTNGITKSCEQAVRHYQDSGSTFNDVLHGIYNLIVINVSSSTVEIYNDSLGCLPCYYMISDNQLILSNSIWLLKQSLQLGVNAQGFAEQFLLGWTIGDKTPLANVVRTSPGTRYTFSLHKYQLPETQRLSKNWTSPNNNSMKDLLPHLFATWQQAVSRAGKGGSSPVGMFLSGGMDSRLVMGEFVAQGVQVVACTHGDPQSQELYVARQVADKLKAKFIVNPMDASFAFAKLSMERVFEETDRMVNPIWHSSTCLLAEAGVNTATTGFLGDVIFGGTYYHYGKDRERFVQNALTSLGIGVSIEQTVDEAIAQIALWVYATAAKRLKHYGRILLLTYYEMCQEYLTKLQAEVTKELHGYLQAASPSGQQLWERFTTEHRGRKHIFAQELIVRSTIDVVVPTADRDVLYLLTNISPNIKQDHHLYYLFFKKYYPLLARIPISNIYGGVAAPQIIIELRRGLKLALERYAKKRNIHYQKRGWANFNEWILASGNLDKYLEKFLQLEQFFNGDEVTRLFEDVRSGKKSLYDGEETRNFITSVKLIQ